MPTKIVLFDKKHLFWQKNNKKMTKNFGFVIILLYLCTRISAKKAGKDD